MPNNRAISSTETASTITFIQFVHHSWRKCDTSKEHLIAFSPLNFRFKV